MTNLQTFSLFAIAVVACLVVARARWRVGRPRYPRLVRVVESLGLTPHVSLHVVSIAGKAIVVAAGPTGAVRLCDVAESALAAPLQSSLAGAPKRERVRVLIVDDAAIMRMVAATILRASGFDVVGEAANGTDARAQYRELRPDVVIADVALPQNSVPPADEPSPLVAILCEDADACVIVSGSIAQRPLIDAALANGACAYVAKPFHPARVVETVRRVLAERPTESLANPEDVRERAENRRV